MIPTRATIVRLLSHSLCLFLFLLPWQTIWIYKQSTILGAIWQYGTLGFYVTEGILWVCVLLFVWLTVHDWREVRTRHFSWSRDRVFSASVLGFCLYVFASTTWATEPDVAWQHALRIMEAFMVFFLLVAGPVPWTRAARWFVLGGLLQGVLAIGQFLMQRTAAFSWLGLSLHEATVAGTAVVAGADIGRWLRAYGAFPHPNVLGGYLVVSLALTIWLWSVSRERSTARLFFLTASLVQTTGLFFTWSRSAWLAAVVLAATLLVSSWRHSRWATLRFAAYHGVLLIVLVGQFFPLLSTRALSSSPTEQRSLSERRTNIPVAWQLIRHQPVLGVGVGNYTAALMLPLPDKPAWAYQPVHVTPLLFLAELGTIGTLLAAMVLICFFYFLSAYRRGLCMGIAMILISMPLLLFDHYLYSSYIGLLTLGVFAGIMVRSLAQSSA